MSMLGKKSACSRVLVQDSRLYAACNKDQIPYLQDATFESKHERHSACKASAEYGVRVRSNITYDG